MHLSCPACEMGINHIIMAVEGLVWLDWDWLETPIVFLEDGNAGGGVCVHLTLSLLLMF